MPRYVIEPVTLLHLMDNDLPLDVGHQLVAPNSIRSETLQLLLQGVRRGDRTDEEALEVHDRITALKLRLLGDRVSRSTAWKIARQHDWDSLRDAEYLAIARLQADAIVTMDHTLAARADGVVPVAPVESLLRGH